MISRIKKLADWAESKSECYASKKVRDAVTQLNFSTAQHIFYTLKWPSVFQAIQHNGISALLLGIVWNCSYSIRSCVHSFFYLSFSLCAYTIHLNKALDADFWLGQYSAISRIHGTQMTSTEIECSLQRSALMAY